MKIKLYLISAIALVFLTGCSKKIVSPGNGPIVVDAGNATGNEVQTGATPDLATYYQADWSSFKSGGNAELSMGGRSLNSSMQMRMHRGKAIYVSLRPIMGIEAAKMVISGDSILLVDKLHKRYVYEKASLLTNGVPVTVDILQDIFLGRAFELGKGSFTHALKDDFTVEPTADGKIKLKPTNQFKGFEYNFIYDSKGNILSLDVTPSKSGASTYSVTYSDIKPSVAGRVAGEVKVATKMGGKAFVLNLDYKDMNWNEVFTIDTNAPGSKYKRIEAKDIMSIFGGGN